MNPAAAVRALGGAVAEGTRRLQRGRRLQAGVKAAAVAGVVWALTRDAKHA